MSLDTVRSIIREEVEDAIKKMKSDGFESIKGKPGWYLIKVIGLNKIKQNPLKASKHVHIPNTIKANSGLKNIESKKFHYFGMAKNVKNRLNAHFSENGYKGTACLALGRYKVNYEYAVIYEKCLKDKLEGYIDVSDDSKALRVFVENVVRSEFGWPILCKA